MRHMWGTCLLSAALLIGCSSDGSLPTTQLEEPVHVIALGAVRADAPSTFVLDVSKPLVPPATIELAEPPVGPFAPAPGVLPREAPQGLFADLKIRFTPPASPAATLQEGTIRLLFRSTDGLHTLPVTLRLTATLDTPSTRLLSDVVDVGRVAIGETIQFGAAIENTSLATPITVLSLTPPSGDFAIAPDASPLPIEVAPGMRLSVPLLYTPTSEGSTNSTIVFRHSVSTTPLEVTLRGTGIPEETSFDFGYVPVDPFTGETDWLRFNVPAEAISIYIEVWGDPDNSLVDLIGFEGPEGKIYETWDLTGPLVWLKNYPAGAVGFLNIQLPNTNAPLVQLVHGGGEYQLKLRDYYTDVGALHVRVTMEQRAGGFAGEGTLDLNVFLADGLSLASRSDPMSDPKLAEVLRTVDALLGETSVRLGNIEFFFMDSYFDTVASEADSQYLIQVNSGTRDEGPLNLFFVKEMLYGTAGVAGAVPGPQLNGTPFSGVVIAYDGADGTTVGASAAHEMSHFLGHVELTGEEEEESLVLNPDEAHAILRHPLLRPGLPSDFLAPPETTNLTQILAALGLMPPMGDWCGTCQRPPLR